MVIGKGIRINGLWRKERGKGGKEEAMVASSEKKTTEREGGGQEVLEI